MNLGLLTGNVLGASLEELECFPHEHGTLQVSPSERTNPGSGPRVLQARQAQQNMKFTQANSRFMPINTDYNFVT